MNQTLSDIFLLEKHLNELDMDAKHEATVYSKNSDEVIEASSKLKTHLFHPSSSKEYYWFDYVSKENPKISIKVKGPTI